MVASTPMETGPAYKLLAVTKHDTTEQNITGCRGIWVGEAGDVALIAEGDSAAVTLVGVPAGTLLPVRATRIMASNTTAGSFVALF